jgi:hypothetical protein
VFDPSSGWWYRIAGLPWNNQYYSPAGEFTNVDPYDGTEVGVCPPSPSA